MVILVGKEIIKIGKEHVCIYEARNANAQYNNNELLFQDEGEKPAASSRRYMR